METIDLRNKHKNEVIDIIGSRVKDIKTLKNNKEKVLKYLNETNNVNEENLKNMIKFIRSSLPEEIFTVKNLDEMRNRLYQFMIWLTKLDLKDGGYSLLISYYLYLTDCLL